MMGRYIDSLNDAERDRVIVAQEWDFWMNPGVPQHCLVMHAEGRAYDACPKADALVILRPVFRSPAASFDKACERFGLARIVRACKLRAARANRIALPQPPEVLHVECV